MRTSAALVSHEKAHRHVRNKSITAPAAAGNPQLQVLKEKLSRMASETVSSIVIVAVILALYIGAGLHGFWVHLISGLI